MTEAWLEGPIEGVPALLMPVAHALVQAREDIHNAVADLTPDQLWTRPGGAASIGFHMMHLAGTIDRLLTYRRGLELTEQQFEQRRREHHNAALLTVAELLSGIDAQVTRAIENLRTTSDDELLEPRAVGRKKLPSTVLGLLFHAAEHTQRHTGQIVTTAIIVRATPL
jgi:uncharacterized damage-inducible protein DinB